MLGQPKRYLHEHENRNDKKPIGLSFAKDLALPCHDQSKRNENDEDNGIKNIAAKRNNQIAPHITRSFKIRWEADGQHVAHVKD